MRFAFAGVSSDKRAFSRAAHNPDATGINLSTPRGNFTADAFPTSLFVPCRETERSRFPHTRFPRKFVNSHGESVGESVGAVNLSDETPDRLNCDYDDRD